MGYDRNAPKRAINVSLNEDLVKQARAHTSNLSGTIESLLQEFVVREQARRRDEDAALDRVIDRFNEIHQQYGLLSDEFSTL
jgi:antitoxin CcdA